MRESKRYLGLELSGAKNPKTAVAVLEFYPKEQKIFLLDIHDRIPEKNASEKFSSKSNGDRSGQAAADEQLISLIDELTEDSANGRKKVRMGVNVPLEMPPCLSRLSQTRCNSAIKWMREMTKKAQRSHQVKVLEFTPYTQRPVELWVRYQVLPKLHPYERFEIDETLGGNKAPLTARMIYLKPYLRKIELIEAWPKLTIAALAEPLGISKRTISAYRRLEEGVQAREDILEALVEQRDVFVYDKDIRKLAMNLSAFDAFLCAYTALLSDLEQTAAAPPGFPTATGWVHYPNLSHR
ncbi:MAG: hypothetical protein ACJ763_00020 [Bdellovibrionia bacterium]